MLRLAIIRSFPSVLDVNNYNVQEIGLAKGLATFGISTDIYSRFSENTSNKVIYANNDTLIRIIPIKGIKLFNKITFYQVLSQN